MGLDENTIRAHAAAKGEPDWMLELRLEGLRHATEASLPRWVDLGRIELDHIDSRQRAEAPSDPTPGEAAGQEAERVFTRNNEALERSGVIFCEIETALRDHPEILERHFATMVHPGRDGFAALNTAAWGGGSFIYVPPGVSVSMPLQAYVRSGAERMGRFERSLIIADEDASVHYIEGCSAPIYSVEPLRSGVVEVVVGPNAHVSYTAIQNWSDNVHNVVTKRAEVAAGGSMRWIEGSIGSRLTIQRPELVLAGQGASGDVLAVAYAGAGQHHDVGATVTHSAPGTRAEVVSRCMASDGGRTDFTVASAGSGLRDGDAVSEVQMRSLVLDEGSTCAHHFEGDDGNRTGATNHEDTISAIGVEQLFYLMSRGLSETQAVATVANGFIEPMTRALPMEYAIEWTRLIELEIEGSIG